MICIKSIETLIKTHCSKAENSNEVQILKKSLSDIIRLSFNACTLSTVECVRICGLELLETIINSFSRIPDPDCPEISILDQFQAQINSGLLLSFQFQDNAKFIEVCSDSQYKSCKVIVRYIKSGVSSSPESISRILKWMIS